MSCQGTVKSFNDSKGWGFIDFGGTDVFLHIKDCTDGCPQVGDLVSFVTEEDKVRGGQLKASSVTGCTGVKSEGKGCGKGFGKGGGWENGCGKGGPQGWSAGPEPQPVTGSCQGTVKSFNDMKGWGFISYEGQDVFLHVNYCGDRRPRVGDWVGFDTEPDDARAGQLKAVNVTGCSGFAGEKGKGKGKDKGGYGAAWGGADAWWGGGGGCGWGNGWPKGGGCWGGGGWCGGPYDPSWNGGGKGKGW